MKNKKEVANYLVFGILTTVVNIISFWLLNHIMDYRIATTIAWVISVIFAFITNKLYVFNSKNKGILSFFKEFISFLFFRSLSYILDLSIMIILIEYMKVDSLITKIISNIFVVIFNYFASKFVIFKPSKDKDS